MKSSVSIARVGLLSILFTTLSFALMACEPMLYITVHNQTDNTLQIFHGGEVFVGEAVPKGEITYQTDGIYSHYTVTAKDLDGNVVYSANFTRDDIVNKNYKYDVYFPPKETETESSDNATGK